MQIPGEATEQRPKLQPDDAGDLDFVASLLHAYGILCQAVFLFWPPNSENVIVETF